MDEPQKKSYKLVWIAGSSFVVLIIVVGVTFALVSQTTKKDDSTKTAAASAVTKQVASKDDIKKGIDKLSTSLKQAATDQAAAKAALANKPVKVGK